MCTKSNNKREKEKVFLKKKTKLEIFVFEIFLPIRQAKFGLDGKGRSFFVILLIRVAAALEYKWSSDVVSFLKEIVFH